MYGLEGRLQESLQPADNYIIKLTLKSADDTRKQQRQHIHFWNTTIEITTFCFSLPWNSRNLDIETLQTLFSYV